MTPSALRIAAIAAVVLSAAAQPRAAEANIVLTQRGCQTYASWSGNLVWARELGASKDKAQAELIALDQKTPGSIYALMLRNLEVLWTTEANWELVTSAILHDCVKRRGVYDAGA